MSCSLETKSTPTPQQLVDRAHVSLNAMTYTVNKIESTIVFSLLKEGVHGSQTQIGSAAGESFLRSNYSVPHCELVRSTFVCQIVREPHATRRFD